MTQCPECGQTRIITHPLTHKPAFACGYSRGYTLDTRCELHCVCDLKTVLMVTGCQCGAFQKERQIKHAKGLLGTG